MHGVRRWSSRKAFKSKYVCDEEKILYNSLGGVSRHSRHIFGTVTFRAKYPLCVRAVDDGAKIICMCSSIDFALESLNTYCKRRAGLAQPSMISWQ